MRHSTRFRPGPLRALAPVALVALLSTSEVVEAQYSAVPITVGQKYFMAVSDFSVFGGTGRDTGGRGPLEMLASEAALPGHESLGVDVVDASAVMQYWSRGGGDESLNPTKAAVRGGEADVLMVSAATSVPDEGIDLFGDLVARTNPRSRILVQSAWSMPDRPEYFTEDPDEADAGTIQGWIDRAHVEGGYMDRLRVQLTGINERAGRRVAFVVPVAEGIARLRQEALLGNVPGIDRQSELYATTEGVEATPVANLATYVSFVVMYRQPADGLTALVDPEDPTSAMREGLLARIAWDVAFAEPMSGVQVGLLWPNGVRSEHDLLHRMSQQSGEGGAVDEGHSRHD